MELFIKEFTRGKGYRRNVSKKISGRSVRN
jgi:hypothetical protein